MPLRRRGNAHETRVGESLAKARDRARDVVLTVITRVVRELVLDPELDVKLAELARASREKRTE